MAILTINESGAYSWRKSGRTLRGQLVPYTARRAAEPGTRYFTINDGHDEFYVSFIRFRGQRYIEVNSRRTDKIVARGYAKVVAGKQLGDPNMRGPGIRAGAAFCEHTLPRKLRSSNPGKYLDNVLKKIL